MSTAARDRAQIPDPGVALVVAAASLALYGATHAASLSALFPPDLPPPRDLGDPQILEYLTRRSGLAGWWPLSAAAAACTVALSYVTARRLGAAASASAAAALALGFGREFWQQSLLPGIDVCLALAAALAGFLSTPVRQRAPSRLRLAVSLACVLLTAGLPQVNAPPLIDTGRWIFLELTAVGLALAMTGVVLARARVAYVATAAGVAALTLVRGASSQHAALLPVYAIVCPFVALGASWLAGWLRPRLPIWLLLLPAVPLLGNARHVVPDSDRDSRRILEAFAAHVDRCDRVIGRPSRSAPPRPEDVPGPRRPGCDVLALRDARAALEHLGYRFETIVAAADRLERQLDLSRLIRRAACETLDAARWTDVTAISSAGRIGILLTGQTGVVIYAGRERPLDPWRPISWTVVPSALDARVFHRPQDDAALAAALKGDAVDPAAFDHVPWIHRIAISGGASSGTSTLMSLDFGGIPSETRARATGARLATICEAPRGRSLFDVPGVSREVIAGGRSFYGAGWDRVLRRDGRDWRPLSSEEGELLFQLAAPASLELTVTASAPTAGGAIALRINGTVLDPQPLRAGPAEYRWAVPPTPWRAGVNQAFVRGPQGLLVADVVAARVTR